MTFNKFKECTKIHHNPILKLFCHPRRSLIPIIVNPGSLPQAQATTSLSSVCIDLPFLDISYKWRHTICGLLCLASFT